MSKKFEGSSKYWENRYVAGRNSGAGSYGRLAEFKAKVINAFVADSDITSVIEWGCGDGAQLKLAKYPSYLGLDIAQKSIDMCQNIFKKDPSKSFIHYSTNHFHDNARFVTAQLAMSLDVIFHLTEDTVYEQYMAHLFNSAEEYVIVYSSNKTEKKSAPHVKHREFTKWIKKNQKNWKLVEKIDNDYPFNIDDPDNTSFADFYIYKKVS